MPREAFFYKAAGGWRLAAGGRLSAIGYRLYLPLSRLWRQLLTGARPFCRLQRHFPALRGITPHQGAPRRGQIEHHIYIHLIERSGTGAGVPPFILISYFLFLICERSEP